MKFVAMLVWVALVTCACAGTPDASEFELADSALYAAVRAEGVRLGFAFDAPACDEVPHEVFVSGADFSALCGGKQALSPHDQCGTVGSCEWSCSTTTPDGAPLLVFAGGWRADDAATVPGWTHASLREARASEMLHVLRQCSDTIAPTDEVMVPFRSK